MTRFPLVRFLLLFSLLLGVAWGQQPLNPADASFTQNFGVDSVNLQNLFISVSTPVISKPGAIPLNYNLRGENGCVGTPNGISGTPQVICSYLPSPVAGTCVDATCLTLTGDSPAMDWIVRAGTSTAGTCPGDGKSMTTNKNLTVSAPGGATYVLPPLDSYKFELGGGSCVIGVTDFTTTGGLKITINYAGQVTNVLYPNGVNYVVNLATNSDAMTDPFGNSLKLDVAGTTHTFTDTLGNATFSYVPHLLYQVPPAPGEIDTYTDSNGASHSISQTLTLETLKTNFGCAAFPDKTVSGAYATTSVNYPDGHNLGISYESITGGITGRIHQITYRTGGAATYAYGTINCPSMIPSSMTRTTTDGTWTYTFALNGTHGTKTTVLDPGKNQTVYYFQGTDANGLPVQGTPLTLTEMQVYQNTGTLASPVNTLLSTTINCYNGNVTACPTTQAAYPILSKGVYVAPGTKTTYSRTKYTYDNGCGGSCGLVTQVDKFAGFVALGAGTIDNSTVITYGSYNGTNCVAVGSGIINLPCRIQTTDTASHILSDELHNYTARGFPANVSHWNGSAWITSYASVNAANGTVTNTTNPLGQVTNYTYTGGCNGLLPTATSQTVNGVALTTGATWNCDMGKIMSATDVNGHTSNFTYDLMGRPYSQTDPSGLYKLDERYLSAASSTLTDSTYFTTTVNVDGYGKNAFIQTTDGASYDTTSTGQGFNGLVYYQYNTSQPCIAALNVGCTINHFSRLDPLGRQFYEATTGNEIVNTVYNQNDVQTTLTPAPSGENNKVTQNEYDGMGRILSTCDLQATGGTACGQIAGGSGILTSYAYAYSAGGVTTTTTRGAQVHTTFTDQLGRVKSFTLPESGTTTNYYDVATCAGSVASAGNLTCSVDAAGTNTIYFYDGSSRLTDVNAVGNGGCRRYRFDDISHAYHSLPTGYSGTNIAGRLMEAETDNCVSPYTAITDEYFAYDDDGRLTDVWETTPHSGGWYHTQAGYAVNGQLTSISGVPGKSAYTIGLDARGRPDASTYGATAVATNVNYNGAGQTTRIDYGSDNDVFGYDTSTGLMNNFTYTLGATAYVGTPLWNANRTLKKLTIVDGFNATDSQTCNFNPTDHAGTGYDDVGRLVGVYCGAVWNQTYSYDQYDNFSKSGTTGWNPGYNSTVTCPTGTICNHITGGGYDSDGQVTFDTNNSFAWDGYHKMITANSGSSLGSCGGSGVVCLTYDALGRAVEKNLGGTFTQYLYSPAGLTAIMSGQTANAFRAPIPGGAIFTSNATGSIVSHLDWLGSARLSATLGHTVSRDTAYSPYGEDYASTGTGIVQEFAGMFTDHDTNVLFDTPNRQFDVSSGSRWLSPDPAHASWNAYAYPTNPNSFIDPSGLVKEPLESLDSPAGWFLGFSGFGNFSGGCTVDGVDYSCAATNGIVRTGNTSVDLNAMAQGSAIGLSRVNSLNLQSTVWNNQIWVPTGADGGYAPLPPIPSNGYIDTQTPPGRKLAPLSPPQIKVPGNKPKKHKKSHYLFFSMAFPFIDGAENNWEDMFIKAPDTWDVKVYEDGRMLFKGPYGEWDFMFVDPPPEPGSMFMFMLFPPPSQLQQQIDTPPQHQF